MVCLREINGFLNRLFCILPLAWLAPSHHFWGLEGSGFLEAPEEERGRRMVIKSTKSSKGAWVQGPAQHPKQLHSVPSEHSHAP